MNEIVFTVFLVIYFVAVIFVILYKGYYEKRVNKVLESGIPNKLATPRTVVIGAIAIFFVSVVTVIILYT